MLFQDPGYQGSISVNCPCGGFIPKQFAPEILPAPGATETTLDAPGYMTEVELSETHPGVVQAAPAVLAAVSCAVVASVAP